jgi:hypothetical protein
MTYSYDSEYDAAILDCQEGGEYSAADAAQDDLAADNEDVAEELDSDTNSPLWVGLLALLLGLTLLSCDASSDPFPSTGDRPCANRNAGRAGEVCRVN